ncbi:MAG: pyridoxal-phosphate dependent enzyme [Pseudomonadota bacterium]
MTVSAPVASLAAQSMASSRRLRETVRQTPCIPSRSSEGLFYKCENLQVTGSFKIRGATNKISGIAKGTPIITASSGNHGIACSHAAKMTGHSLTVVLPESVAATKRAQIEALGTKTILVPGDSGQAEREARRMSETGEAIYVSPYNDHTIMAGQGTIGIELLEQMPVIDAVFISMGGGGLIAGIGAAVKAFSPQTRIVGVSADNSGAFAASLAAGRIVETEHLDTLADGCAGGVDDDTLTFPIAHEIVDEVVSCSEDEIAQALCHLAWTEKLLVEGAAALALAGYFAVQETYGDLTSVVILCGSNFDTAKMQNVLSQTPSDL